jgi:hypothetical protein
MLQYMICVPTLDQLVETVVFESAHPAWPTSLI